MSAFWWYSGAAEAQLATSGTPHTVNPEDTIALTDAVVKTQGLVQADTLALADEATPLLQTAIPNLVMPPPLPAAWPRAPSET